MREAAPARGDGAPAGRHVNRVDDVVAARAERRPRVRIAELPLELHAQVHEIDVLVELVRLGVPVRQHHLVVAGFVELVQVPDEVVERVSDRIERLQVRRREVRRPPGGPVVVVVVMDVRLHDGAG
jgi:hypothetical protein